MDTKKSDGGPAFPATHIATVHGEIVNAGVAGGMSLLDYFAGQLIAETCRQVREDMKPVMQKVFEMSGVKFGTPELKELLESDEMKQLDDALNRRAAGIAYRLAAAMLVAKNEAAQ